MSEGFRKIKRSRFGESIIKSVIFGLSLGIFILTAVIFILHRADADLSFSFYLLIGSGVAIISGVVLFLLLNKSDKALARALDEEYSLREKVRTMLAFSDEEGEMIELQRKDAEKTINCLPRRGSFVRRFGAWIAAFTLSVALFVTNAVAISLEKEPAPPPEEVIPEIPFAISEFQVGALESLINTVRTSDFDTALRLEMTGELEDLLITLKQTNTESKMKKAVIQAVVSIDLMTENTATYKRMASALAPSADGNARLFAAALLSLNGEGFGENIAPIKDDFTNKTVYNEKIQSFASDVRSALAISGVDEADPIYIGVLALATDAEALLARGLTNMEAFGGEMGKIFNSVSNTVGVSLSVHHSNKAARDLSINTLIDIFGISRDELPPLLGDQYPMITLDPDSGSKDENDREDSGGYGEGNEKYGSNDEIYDPFGENGAGYVPYPEAYDSYHKAIVDLLNYGDLDAETRRMLIQYFLRLSDGTTKSE